MIMDSQVVVGGHVLVVEFHTYIFHLIDAIPDFDLPRTNNQRKYSLFEKEDCEELTIVVQYSNEPPKEYFGIRFPKSYTQVLWFYLFGTKPIFFPSYDYHTLSKEGVTLRNAVLQTGVSHPHTVLIPELMINKSMGNITRIKWSCERFNFILDFLPVNLERSLPPRNLYKLEVDKKTPILRRDLVDLTCLCKPTFDQGDLGTCGVSAVVSFLDFALSQRACSISGEEIPNTERRLSVMFLYWTSRVLMANVSPEDDAGVELKDCIEALRTYGICQESEWPYITTNFLLPPSELAFQRAKLFNLPKLKQLHNLEEMKESLRNTRPFFMDVMFTDESYGLLCVNGNIPEHPSEKWDDACVHSCFVVGYNDSMEMLIFQNSWSNQWGKNGFGLLPYVYITRNLFQSAFSWDD